MRRNNQQKSYIEGGASLLTFMKNNKKVFGKLYFYYFDVIIH